MPHTSHHIELKKREEELILDFVSKVIRVIPKIDRVRLTALLAETILVTHMDTTRMHQPQLGPAVRAKLGLRHGVRPLAQRRTYLSFTVGTVPLLN